MAEAPPIEVRKVRKSMSGEVVLYYHSAMRGEEQTLHVPRRSRLRRALRGVVERGATR